MERRLAIAKACRHADLHGLLGPGEKCLMCPVVGAGSMPCPECAGRVTLKSLSPNVRVSCVDCMKGWDL